MPDKKTYTFDWNTNPSKFFEVKHKDGTGQPHLIMRFEDKDVEPSWTQIEELLIDHIRRDLKEILDDLQS